MGETSDSATIYFQLGDPYDLGRPALAPRFVKAGKRRFGFFVDEDGNARFLEVRGRALSGLATVDLRAWVGCTEFLFWLEWREDNWRVRAPVPNSDEEITIAARPVRGVCV